MLTIATLLDTNSDSQTRQIWNDLESACNLSEIRLMPFPHFSWQSAQDYNLPKVEQIISGILANLQPFPVMFTGIGLFLDPFPIIYLNMVVSETILLLHEKLWEELNLYTINRNEYYKPGLWQPHITIAYGDVDHNKLACAFENLLFKELKLKIIVDNVSVLYNINGEAGIKKKIMITS